MSCEVMRYDAQLQPTQAESNIKYDSYIQL